MGKPIIIAHRGFRVGACENTVAAFKVAVDHDVDFIELDVHLSKDGAVVVIHDETVDRVFDGSGRVENMTLEELKRLVSRNGNDRIPTLEEVLDAFGGRVGLMIELKGAGTPGAVARLLSERKDENLHRIVLSSRNVDYLREAVQAHEERLGTKIKTCLNITKCPAFTVDDLMECEDRGCLPLDLHMISLRSSFVFEEFIDKCHQLGVEALCWDFLNVPDPFSRTLELYHLGIDGILFDDPAVLERFRNELRTGA